MKLARFLGLTLLAGCTLPGGQDGTPAPDNDGSDVPVDASVTLKGMVHPTDPQSWQFDLRLDRATPVQLVCDEATAPYERHLVTRGAADLHKIVVRGLKADTRYHCMAELLESPRRLSSRVEIRTAPLPPDLIGPIIAVPAADPAKIGYTLFNTGLMNLDVTYNNPYLLLTDAQGNIRWYYQGLGGGDVDVSYLGDDRVLFGGSGGGLSYAPTIVGLDKEVKFVGTFATTGSKEYANSWHHDSGLSADGGSIFSFSMESVPDQSWRGFVVKEIDLETNRLLWSWSSIDNGVASGALLPGSSETIDPFHANSIFDRWENGRLYVYLSLRNLNSVLKIDYLTKDVVWSLGVAGDFTLLEKNGQPAADQRWFFGQHDAQLHGNRLTIYDNGAERPNYGGTAYSRALILELNENARTARIISEYTEENWLEPAWGGYDVLPDNTSLLAIGHCRACGSPTPQSSVVRLDADNNVMWRMDLRHPHAMLYRAEHIDGCAIFHNLTYCRP